MAEYFTAEALSALFTVIMIDLVLAGDNAVVVGMAAAGLPPELRRKAILIGIAAATIMRIVFAIFTSALLSVVGLLVAGGLLLLWVSWKLWREIREGAHREQEIAADALEGTEGSGVAGRPRKTLRAAVIQILVADVTMSLDNVLAVAGAARHHWEVLIFGLALSVALMGLAATFIARLLQRHHWIAYVGLVLILYVAARMIWDGGHEVLEAMRQA